MTMRWIILCSTLLGVPAAHAGSYTVTTTPEQDAAVTQIAASVTRSGQKMTPEQAVQFIIDRNLQTRVEEIQRTATQAAACAKVTDAKAKKTLGCPK
jgi:hypothetical protein